MSSPAASPPRHYHRQHVTDRPRRTSRRCDWEADCEDTADIRYFSYILEGETPDYPPPSYKEAQTGGRSAPRQPQQDCTVSLAHHRRSPRRSRQCRRAGSSYDDDDYALAHATRVSDRRRRTQHRDSSCRLGRARMNTPAEDDVDEVLHEEVCDVFSRLDHVNADDVTESDEDLTRQIKRLSLSSVPRKRSTGLIDFKKTWLYANSRLPPYMMPLRLYLPTWSIICLAAQASVDVYRSPRSADEREDHIAADRRIGTKAMTIKTRPLDDKNTIVVAIRGSQWNYSDWSVNFGTAPASPAGFLDDEGNACHSGFLSVAKAMVGPIAQRLRDLLQQVQSRYYNTTLILTGHSAGGAVASLLYMHMHSTKTQSELNYLAPFFRRIHCVTFGSPPLTLLPLQNPPGSRYEKNVFIAFANEGDPVVRADRQYVRTITRLLAAPSPVIVSKDGRSMLRNRDRSNAHRDVASHQHRPPRWEVVPSTLSNAGRLALLRETPNQKGNIEAVQVTDRELREVVFGDPEMHAMTLYKRRIDRLAIEAVTGGIEGN